MSAPTLATRPADTPPSGTPSRRAIESLRWTWRSLTSMRTALLLLFLLAVAAIPGSIVPQSRTNPIAVSDFAQRRPGLAPLYRRLDLFDVFGSPWFAAIYLLLMVSLVGCIVPRLIRHAAAMRTAPPRAPTRLGRLGSVRNWTLPAEDGSGGGAGDRAFADATAALRSRRYRVLDGVDPDGRRWLAAERGRSRETGNVVFHIAVLVVLVGMAATSLLGFRGTALVVVGNGFSNTVTQYDGISSGRLVAKDDLTPFSLALTDFTVRFEEQTPSQIGAARDFDATLDVTPEPGARTVTDHLRVNHPLHIGSDEVHLIGHGYAPVLTVRDARGEIAFSGPAPFLPQDGNFTSLGVVKVPDARGSGAAPGQIGLQGLFLPSAVLDPTRGPVSTFPDALNPALFLTAYVGDLGLDTGTPQSVYTLDTHRLRQLTTGDGQPFRKAMSIGQTVTLPAGAGTVRFDGYRRWVNLQVSSRPGTDVVLAGALLALAGLTVSLFVPRRRAWLRVDPGSGHDAGRIVITLAGLDQRAPSGHRTTEGLDADLDEVAGRTRGPVLGSTESGSQERTP